MYVTMDAIKVLSTGTERSNNAGPDQTVPEGVA